MTKRNLSLISSPSIALLGCLLVSSPLYGQSESALKEFFEGTWVVVRIDMPASHEGVDVYPKGAELIDWEEYRRELKKYGTALPRDQRVVITKIKTKSNHIEFQLDGGGWGTLVDAVGGVANVVAIIVLPPQKSQREIELERQIDEETNHWEKERLEEELKKLQRERSRRDEEEKSAREKSKREGGSRFNIRYESKLTDADMTPDSVMAALSEYLDFIPDVQVRLNEKPPPPRKLYPIDEAHLDPSFAQFKDRLLEAVERRDLDFLLSISVTNVAASLKRNWEARDWQELRDILSLGAVRVSYGFCAPYVSTKFPYALNAFESVVITGSDVPIRAEPNSTAAVIDHLSYDIVSDLSRGASWDTIEGEKYQWWRIETPSGEIGYVWGKYARSPMGFEVCFDKPDGQWLMTSWSGGWE